VWFRGIPHLAKNQRDTPNFLHAALDNTACAPFFKERRMKFGEPTRLHRKLGIWGTPWFRLGTEFEWRNGYECCGFYSGCGFVFDA
jgi:hypothetical protein